MFPRPTSFLEQRSKVFLFFFGLALFAAVVLVERAIDWQIDTSIFYLLPISYFAWYFSSKTASSRAWSPDFLRAYFKQELQRWFPAVVSGRDLFSM